MEISMKTQLIITAYAVIVGAVIGIIYDIIRISRVFSGVTETSSQSKMYTVKLPLIGAGIDRKHDFPKFCGFREHTHTAGKKKKKAKVVSEFYKNIIVFAGDILFFFIVSPIFTVFIYYANNGKIRWYLIIGSIVGFMLYYITIGRIIMLFSSLIVFIIRSAGAYLIYFTIRPAVIFIRFIFGIIKALILRIVLRIKTAVMLKKMRKYTKKSEKSITLIVRADF